MVLYPKLSPVAIWMSAAVFQVPGGGRQLGDADRHRPLGTPVPAAGVAADTDLWRTVGAALCAALGTEGRRQPCHLADWWCFPLCGSGVSVPHR